MPVLQSIDNGLLNQAHQLARAHAAALNINEQIHHQLAWAMISHLAATIRLHHGNIARHQHVLGLTGLTLGKHARVLQ